jgi:hypothetical protein
LTDDVVQILSAEEVRKLMNYEFEKVEINLIKEGCDMINIWCSKPYIHFVKKTSSQEEDELAIREILARQGEGPNIVVFSDLDKNHPRFSYYRTITIHSSDLLDLKKALKVHKLKAFL